MIGCLDPGGARILRLAAWTQGRDLAPLARDGAFALWRRAGAKGQPLDTAEHRGFLTGDTLPPGRPGTEGAVGRVLRAYRDLGPSAVAGVPGQFALVLWDRQRQELLLYTDESATRALYYYRPPTGGLIFADDLDLLVGCPLVDRRLSRTSVQEYLRLLQIAPPNTIYADVFATEPGAVGLYGRHGLTPGHAVEGHPERLGATHPPRGLAAAAEALDRRLDAAVSRRLDPAARQVALLSGGPASALMGALAAARTKGAVSVLTLTPPGDLTGYGSGAAALAGHLGLPWESLAPSLGDYRRAFATLTAGTEGPVGDPALLPSLMAYRAARQQGTAVLDGTGAGALFGPGPSRAKRFALTCRSLCPDRLRSGLATTLGYWRRLRPVADLIGPDDPEEALIPWPTWTRREIETLCGEPVSLAHTGFYRGFAAWPKQAQRQRQAALLASLARGRLRQAARLAEVEVRLPFLDEEVWALVSSLGEDLTQGPQGPGQVLRAALARRVPAGLWHQSGPSLTAPLADLLAAEGYDLVRVHLAPAKVADWDLLDPESVRRIAVAFMAGSRRVTCRVWALVILFAWMEGHFRRP